MHLKEILLVAKLHAKKWIKYKLYKIISRKKYYKKKFDVILNLEIIEHVQDVDLFLKSCSKMLNKGGIMFVATLNRTFESYIKAIVGAEYILRWLPIGTHEWNKFLKPNEIQEKLKKLDFENIYLDGFSFNLFSQSWKKTKDCSVNYIIVAKKN